MSFADFVHSPAATSAAKQSRLYKARGADELSKIWNYLTFKDVETARLVCKDWKKAVDSLITNNKK